MANLTGANLNNVKLKSAFFDYAKLSNADLSLTDELFENNGITR
jgi:uncharacterized protein YjbI with pentapeptide repeats